MSLWPLFRVCNTTSLLYAHHRDTETGREEEEEDTQYIYYYYRVTGLYVCLSVNHDQIKCHPYTLTNYKCEFNLSLKGTNKVNFNPNKTPH